MSETEPVKLGFPPEESSFVAHIYNQANTIVEYGAGSSTLYAVKSGCRKVLSIESDREWAERVQKQADTMSSGTSVDVRYVNIGPTGDWGRPHGASYWPNFYKYPMAPWAQGPFDPDVVLIDGRFRAACFLATVESIKRPVTLLFDDYENRPQYHLVERIASPVERVGRMAVFRLTPQDAGKFSLNEMLDVFFRVSYSDGGSRVPKE